MNPTARRYPAAMNRPRIGITCRFQPAGDQRPATGDKPPSPHRDQLTLAAAYYDIFFELGALPVPLAVPPRVDQPWLEGLLDSIDALVLTGGRDLPPGLYGQRPHEQTKVMHDRRATFEPALFRLADERRLPVLAICLGHQLVHVARGARLIQHLPDLPRENPLEHSVEPPEPHGKTCHRVRVEPDSRLAAIVGMTVLETNSRHHQAVDPQHPGRGLRPVAWSEDGILEASEDFSDSRWLLSVQWHPEDLTDIPQHRALFEAIVAAARERAQPA